MVSMHFLFLIIHAALCLRLCGIKDTLLKEAAVGSECGDPATHTNWQTRTHYTSPETAPLGTGYLSAVESTLSWQC